MWQAFFPEVFFSNELKSYSCVFGCAGSFVAHIRLSVRGEPKNRLSSERMGFPIDVAFLAERGCAGFSCGSRAQWLWFLGSAEQAQG